MRLRAQNAVLKERNRIARELHDTMAQGLIGIKVQLQVAEELLNVAPEHLGPYLKRAREIAHDSILEARQSVWTLRGGVALELDPIASLGRDVHATAEHSGLMVTVETSGVGRVMASHRYAELSRLLREAVVNVIRHAHAQHLHCEIRADAGALEVVIADDGCGFDPERVVSALA
jgi:signal transduction histidine kinase